jgi:hypothetical protein
MNRQLEIGMGECAGLESEYPDIFTTIAGRVGGGADVIRALYCMDDKETLNNVWREMKKQDELRLGQ